VEIKDCKNTRFMLELPICKIQVLIDGTDKVTASKQTVSNRGKATV
jgi:hypothetical protein